MKLLNSIAIIFLWIATIFISLTAGYWLLPRLFLLQKQPVEVPHDTAGNRKVLLICLDGCSYDLVTQWAEEGKLPNLRNLIADGASGYLSTLKVKKGPKERLATSSPVIWATLATGKCPDRHGIWDFGQPLPGNTYVWMKEKAEIILPTTKRTALTIHMHLKAADRQSRISIALMINETPLQSIDVTEQPQDITVPVEIGVTSPEGNFLHLRLKDPSRIAGDSRSIGCRLVTVENSEHDLLGRIDPWRDPSAFSSGWELPSNWATPIIQTAHRQVRAIWDILSEHGKSVAILGWWGTWPAYKVNGLMLSSHLGARGHKLNPTADPYDYLLKTPALTYPPDYVRHITKAHLLPAESDTQMMAYAIDLKGCRLLQDAQSRESVVTNVIAQDQLYGNLARDILRTHKAYDLMSIYFEGMDVVGHKFGRFSFGRRSKEDRWVECPDRRLEKALEKYYRHIDTLIGQLLVKAGDTYDTIMITTDHGFDERGHADNGWVLLRGPGIKKTVIRQASVLDITPTLLYLFGLPVADDMDGRPLSGAFAKATLEAHPIKTIPTYETSPLNFIPAFSEIDKDLEERLRDLGYIQ